MAELIQTRREPDGRWRWVYLETDENVELRSSELYTSRGDAEEAATGVYPGVAVETPSSPDGRVAGEAGTITLLRRAATSVVLLAALLWALKIMGSRSSPA